MPWYGDLSDKLLVAQVVADASVSAVSRFEGWGLCTDLLAQLQVTEAAADGGDALAVTLQHSVDREHWADLLVFTPIAGDATLPVTEVVSVGKGAGDVAWGQHLRALATPSSATAAFVVGELRIVGS